MDSKQRLLLVALFSAAMAWVESAVVVYLRTLIDRIEPYQTNPLPNLAGLSEIELVREAATLIMLLAVGWLAGSNVRTRFAYAAFAFGTWDILYYVFLVPISGWPRALLDWDILFLLPLPWWGPVLAPGLIAALMIIFGILVTQLSAPSATLWHGALASISALIGMGLALYTFMADALAAVGQGTEAIRNVLPVSFNYPLFALALLLMLNPILDIASQLLAPRLSSLVRHHSPMEGTRQ